MSEIEIDGQYYRCGKMSTRVQWHVAKRLMPVVQGLSPLFAAAAMQTITNPETGEMVSGLDAINVFEAVVALTNTLGGLSDADEDYIIDSCLACVAWRQGERWQPLRAPGGVFLNGAADAFDIQLRLVWEVLRESLSSFSLGRLLPSQTAGNGMDPAQPMAAPMGMIARPRTSSA